MTVLNSLIARLLWALLGPLREWPPLAGLTVVSLFVAVGLLVIIKYTSNQRALADTKRQILASLFELRLFQDDPRLMLRATGGLLRQQGRYLAYAFVPVLVAFIPLSLLLPHLEAYYGYASLRPGDSTTVIVRLKPEAPALAAAAPDSHPCDAVSLRVSPGLHVDTPCVWAPTLREGAWRVSVEREGDFTLDVNGSIVPVRVTSALVPRSPVTGDASWWEAWLHPAAQPLAADGPFEAITVIHPTRAIDLAGLSLSWPVAFFILATVFMLAGRPILRVTL